MDALIVAVLWLLPPLVLIASYWQIAAAQRLSVLTRNALAIGSTAALVVLIGFDAIGIARVGPWSAHPHAEWPLTVALGAVTAAAFAFPTGWSTGTIYQHLRTRFRKQGGTPAGSGRALSIAWFTLALLMLAYIFGLAQLAALAKRAEALHGTRDHRGAAP